MEVAAIDTQIFIWGMLPADSEINPDLIRRAKLLFRTFDEQKTRVLFPSICLSEVLVKIPTTSQSAFISSVASSFEILPFDVKSAALSADIFNTNQHLRIQGVQGDRVTHRADCLIVATAKAHGATTFYSHDVRCRTIANSTRMLDKDLPDFDESLFDN